MGLFKEIAEPLVRMGVPVIPLRPKTKIAFQNNWPELATTDSAMVAQWDLQDPNFNGACVAFAKPNGTWFLEIDKPGFKEVIEKETGKKIPATFVVRSSPGRGHFYFKHTAASIAMGNVQGKDSDGKESWSARADKRYVVAPLSYHPTSGLRYEILLNSPIIEAPDWLVEWCVRSSSGTSIHIDRRTGHVELDATTPISEGGRNNELTKILGKARQVMAMDAEQLYQYGVSVNQQRCNPPLPDSEVRTIANSMARYDVKQVGQLLFDEQPTPAANVVIPTLKKHNYPVFPEWVMHGTSIYEGLVKPVCEVNSRIPYFMFLPTAALMMNYLGNKVNVVDGQKFNFDGSMRGRNHIPSFYMILIGEKGRAIKSSSVEDGIDYLSLAGAVSHASDSISSSGGKSLVWTAGSPEGLGLDMNRTNCLNAVLFYDELSALSNKAGIDHSTLKQAMLTMYESGKFANTIKARKDRFSLDPRTYCASLIACTTDENFEDIWMTMTGKSSGLDDRFMFILQPAQLPELTPKSDINTVKGAMLTKERIMAAVLQKTYIMEDSTALDAKISVLGNRTEIRAEKWALYFAIDLGKQSIDESCVERGIAIAEYEKAVKKYLRTPEAETKIAAAQLKFRKLLENKFNGLATERDMERAMNYTRFGTEGWYRIYEGLKKAGIVLAANGEVRTLVALED
jgi:Bifunctional DNA primase/polymerase, N-terminal/Primase C terminal 1 (PriCT-1)